MFGLTYQKVSKCFQLFLKFMKTYWSYLVYDNLIYWRDDLQAFSDRIRLKVNEKGASFPDIPHPHRFNIFSFIDTKMIFTCRPGGGPIHGGPNAPRFDPLIQRAFYSGYKKGHGLKVQNVILPNGMDLWISIYMAPCPVVHMTLQYLGTRISINESMMYNPICHNFVMFGCLVILDMRN